MLVSLVETKSFRNFQGLRAQMLLESGNYLLKRLGSWLLRCKKIPQESVGLPADQAQQGRYFMVIIDVVCQEKLFYSFYFYSSKLSILPIVVIISQILSRRHCHVFDSNEHVFGMMHRCACPMSNGRWPNTPQVESKPPGTGLHYEQGTINITVKQNDSGSLQACCFARSLTP